MSERAAGACGLSVALKHTLIAVRLNLAPMSDSIKAEVARRRRRIPLLGVLVGWALGQSARLLHRKRPLERYDDASYAELREAHSALKTRVHDLHEALATFLETRAITYFPAPIDDNNFRAWFTDGGLELSESERLSLTHIFGHLDNLNWRFSQIRANKDFLSGNQVENQEEERRIVQLMAGAYVNGCEADAMIELVLLDRARSDIKAREARAHIAKATAQAEVELRKLAEGARQRQKEPDAAGKDAGNH